MSTTGPLTDDELVALGLYDPDAPGAAERLVLVRMALERGVAIDEIRREIDEKRLHAVAAIRLIEGGTERITLEEAASRAGVDVDLARRTWRAFGLAEPEDGARPCSELDVQMLALIAGLVGEIGDDAAFQIARAMGASLARLADAEVAAIRASLEAPFVAGTATDAVDIARALVGDPELRRSGSASPRARS